MGDKPLWFVFYSSILFVGLFCLSCLVLGNCNLNGGLSQK